MLFRSLRQLAKEPEVDPQKILNDIITFSQEQASQADRDAFIASMDNLSAETLIKAFHNDDVNLSEQAKIIYECFCVPSSDYYQRLYNIMISKNRFFGVDIKTTMIKRWLCLVATGGTPAVKYTPQHHLAIAKKFYEWKYNAEAIAHVISAMKLSNGQLKPFSTRATKRDAPAKEEMLKQLRNAGHGSLFRNPQDSWLYFVNAVNYLYDHPGDIEVYEQFALTILKQTQSDILHILYECDLFFPVLFDSLCDAIVCKDIMNPLSCFEHLKAGNGSILNVFLTQNEYQSHALGYRILFRDIFYRKPNRADDGLAYASFLMEKLPVRATSNLDIVVAMVPYFYRAFGLCQRDRFASEEAYLSMRAAFMDHPYAVFVRSVNVRELLKKVGRRSRSTREIDANLSPLLVEESPLFIQGMENYADNIDELKLQAATRFNINTTEDQARLQVEMKVLCKAPSVRR